MGASMSLVDAHTKAGDVLVEASKAIRDCLSLIDEFTSDEGHFESSVELTEDYRSLLRMACENRHRAERLANKERA